MGASTGDCSRVVFRWSSRGHGRPVRMWRIHGGCDSPAADDDCDGGCDHRGGNDNGRYVRTELACGRNRADRSPPQWVTLRSPGLRRLLRRLLRAGRRHRHDTRDNDRSRPHSRRADGAHLGRRGRSSHARRSRGRASAQHQRRSRHLDPRARRGTSPRREGAPALAMPRPAAPWRSTRFATSVAAGPQRPCPGPLRVSPGRSASSPWRRSSRCRDRSAPRGCGSPARGWRARRRPPRR